MLVEFINSETSYVLEFGHKYIRFSVNHGTLLNPTNGEIFELASPYSAEDLKDLKHIQNGDYLYLFHKKHPIHTVKRIKEGIWLLERFDIKNGAWDKVNTSATTLTIGAMTGDTIVTSSNDLFDETDVGRWIRITNEDDTDISLWVSGKDYNAGAYVKSDNKYYTAKTTGKSGSHKPTHTVGSKSDGGVVWEYTNCSYGTAIITGVVDSKKVKVSVVERFPSNTTYGSAYWELGLIKQGNYPICGTFFRGRFAFMLQGTGYPTVCLSCSDDYNNFADKSFGEVLDTNAITVPIISDRYLKGSWLASGDVLFVGTTSGEFMIDSATTSEPMSPSNCKNQKISEIGANSINPIQIGGHLLYVTSDNVGVRDLIYSFETDGYDPIDLSIMGKHLLNSGITSMKYQESPDKIIWFTVEDGRLIGMTFSSEQKVLALHQHTLGGDVKYIAVIPNPNHKQEDLWVEVERDLEGRYSKSIEYIETELNEFPKWIKAIPDIEEKKEQEDIYLKEKAFYLDGGVEGSTALDPINTYLVARSENLYGKGIMCFGEYEIETLFFSKEENRKNIQLRVEDYLREEKEQYELQLRWDVKDDSSKVYTFNVAPEFNGCRFNVIYGGKVQITDRVINQTISFEVDSLSAQFCVLVLVKEIPEVSTLSNLDHLEGKEVAIYADGAELERQVVKDGKISITGHYSIIKVGLPIVSEFIPQTLIIQTQGDSGIGSVQRIDHIVMTLYKSGGGKVGSNNKDLRDILFRKTDDKMNQSYDLFTGNKELPIDLGSSLLQDKGATILLYNDSIFPMTVLAISPRFSSSGGRR